MRNTLQYPMLKVWLYEMVTVISFGVSLTVVNDILQFIVLIIGIISGLLALKNSISKKKKKYEKD